MTTIKVAVNIAQILLLIFAAVSSIRILGLKRKTTVAACCCCVIAFSFLSVQFTQTFVKVEEELTITVLNEKSEESLAPEVDISSLRIDGDVTTSYKIVDGHWYSISGRYSWRPPEDARWDGTATDSITLKIPVGWERYIQFHGNAWRGYATIEKPDGTVETVNTYSEESRIYSFEIGQSDTKLLLLQEAASIIFYALILGILTCLFICIAKRGGITEKDENQFKKKKKLCLTSSKKQWIKATLFASVLAITVAVFAVSNLRDRIKTDAVILAPIEQTESMPITEQYVQTFAANGTFNQIQLRFCTYGRINNSTTTIQLVDDMTEEILESWEIDNSSISEETVVFELTNERSKGTYKLIVESHNPDAETSIGIYLQDATAYNGELFISNELQNTHISIGLYQETNLGLFLFIGVLFASVICVWIAYVLLFILKLNLWKVAFVLIMGFGSVYLAIFPSGCVNDSWRHYVTVYQYSNELFGIAESDAGTVMMRADDRNEFLRYRGLPRTAGIATYFEEFDEFSFRCKDTAMLDCGEKSLGDATAESSVAYLPQTLGLTIGRILSLGTIPCMYLARFLQLLSVAALISASVAIIPKGKEILLLIALLPIFLQQITAFSYDGIAFGFAFLFIAVCVRLKTQPGKASMLEYTLLLMATIGLCACRGGMYIFLLLLFALIPRQTLGRFPQIYLSGIGLFTVISLFGKTYFGVSAIVGSSDTLTYGSPFQHPIKVGLHFISSILEGIDVYWGGTFGNRMGWSEVITPVFLALGFTLMILLVSLPDDNNIHALDKKTRIVYSLPVILTLGFCLGSMYLAESHRATKWYIWGVQGRYLIPVLPLTFFQVQNNSVVMKKNIRSFIIYAFCVWEVIEIFYLMRTFITR